VSEIELGDFPAAVSDLERVVSKDPKYDFYRAPGLLAHAYGKTGQAEKADTLFRKTVQISTLSETYLNYANFLASQGRTAEAREWTERILAKKPTLPGYLKRRERPWFRKAKGLLKQLPAS
jgi:Tfp pilus assembly protein PilF